MKNTNPLQKFIFAASCALALTSLAAQSLAEEPTAKLKPFPLKTCPVSGAKLGDMGKPYVFDYQGREIKLCCKGCLSKFTNNPAVYIKKLETAEAAAKKESVPEHQH